MTRANNHIADFFDRNMPWLRPILGALVLTMAYRIISTIAPETHVPVFTLKIVWVICLGLTGFFAAITDTATAKYVRGIAPVALFFAVLITIPY